MIRLFYLISCLILVQSSNLSALENGYSFFKDPIRFKSGSVSPKDVIQKALLEKKWKVASVENNKIVGVLDNYKNHTIEVIIEYSDTNITFPSYTARSTKCDQCKITENKVIDWLFLLRKTISKLVHQELLNQAKNEVVFFDPEPNTHPLMSNNPAKIKVFAKELIKSKKYFVSDLDFGAERLYLDMNNGALSDPIAYICKLLGQSRNGRYKAVLSEVAQNSTVDKIQSYAKSSLAKLNMLEENQTVYMKGDVQKNAAQ